LTKLSPKKKKKIVRLKNHNKKLLAQINKAKVTKQYGKKLEQEKEDLEKKIKKNLLKKEEENSRLKNLNQELLEQIKKILRETLNDGVGQKPDHTRSDKETGQRPRSEKQSSYTTVVNQPGSLCKHPI
jgi:DNA anti-recombination protein RmuC